MLNYKLKSFLKYLRSNGVIEEYELLFDKFFDFSKLLDLDDESVNRIKFSNGSAIALYEEVNGITIPNNIFNYIVNLDNKELQKYAVRMSVHKYNSEESLAYISSVCEGKSVASSRYAYSVAMSDKLDKSEKKLEYLSLIANSDEKTSIQMRDLLLEDEILEKDEILNLLQYLSTENEYVARYMIKLYKDTHSFDRIPILSFAIGETQARYTYEILRNSKLMSDENGTLIAFLVAESEVEDSYKIISLIREGNYDNLYERVRSILKKGKEEIDIDELFKSRNLDTIISRLSYVDDNKDIKSKVKK